MEKVVCAVRDFLEGRSVEWSEELLAAADEEGVYAVVAHGMGRREELVLGHFRANARRITVLRALSKELAEAGQRVLVIKGGALLFSIYAGRVSLRPLSDLDLVGTPEALALCRSDLVLDLHEDVLGSSRVSRRRAAFSFEPRELWRLAVPVEEGSAVYRMCLEHELLLGAVHALKHSYSRLIWLVDLALLAREVDGSLLLELARRTGTERPLAYACVLLRELFGVELPSVSVRLNRLERRFLWAAVQRRQSLLGGELLVVFSIRGWLDRLLYLVELAFPPDEMDPSAPLPARVWRRLRHLARLAWRDWRS